MSTSKTKSGLFIYADGRHDQPKCRPTASMCLHGIKYLSQSTHSHDGTGAFKSTAYCLSPLRTKYLLSATATTADAAMSSTAGGKRFMQCSTKLRGLLCRKCGIMSLYARTVLRQRMFASLYLFTHTKRNHCTTARIWKQKQHDTWV